MRNIYRYCTAQERFLVLLCFVLVTLLCGGFIHYLTPFPITQVEEGVDSIFWAEVERYEQSLLAQPLTSSRRTAYSLFHFDPNTADTTTLVRLGFSPFTARNIAKYRSAGGTFYHINDLAKMYGIDTAFFRQIKRYVCIDTSQFAKRYTSYYFPKSLRQVSTKFTRDTLLNLNQADTLLLQRVPGIGPSYARRIIAYRQQLGGYVALEQLKEVYGVIDSLYQQWRAWFVLPDTLSLQKICINEWSLTKLYRHPYLNFYQAKVITELRSHYGRIHSLRELVLLEEFTDEDFKRLAPYLDFGKSDKGLK